MNPVIPAPVPVPLPAPAWLLQLLLVFTFILHLVPMNLLMGGAAMLAVSSYVGRKNAHHRELTRRASRLMPPVVAFTITLGVAPLLFLQLLYGQLFYTSSVLMAWAWLAVILLLVFGYYGIYWFSLQQEELGAWGFWVILVTAIIFLHIMMIFVQNMTLLERPQDFYSQFMARSVGAYLGSLDALTVARFFHMLVASLAVAGLGVALVSGYWKKEAPEFAAWARRYGLKWFLAGTGVQFLVGIWFLLEQPAGIRARFLGGDSLATALLGLAIVLAVLAMLAASRSPAASCFAIVGTISLMAVVRHLVRLERLQPYFDARTLPVEGQWVVFILFAILLVAGLVTVGWMLYKFFRATPSPSAPA
jgi:hypothetical protein